MLLAGMKTLVSLSRWAIHPGIAPLSCWPGRQIRSGKRGSIPKHLAPILRDWICRLASEWTTWGNSTNPAAQSQPTANQQTPKQTASQQQSGLACEAG